MQALRQAEAADGSLEATEAVATLPVPMYLTGVHSWFKSASVGPQVICQRRFQLIPYDNDVVKQGPGLFSRPTAISRETPIITLVTLQRPRPVRRPRKKGIKGTLSATAECNLLASTNLFGAEEGPF